MFCVDCASFVFRDFDSESACVDGIVALSYVIEVLSARGFGDFG